MANKVKEYRKKRGLTQDELAKLSGFSRQTIINIERGKLKYSHWWTMKCIADALGATVTELFLS